MWIILAIVVAIVVAFVAALFFGEFVGIAVFIVSIAYSIGTMISDHEKEQKQKHAQQKAEQEAEQKKQYYAEFIALIDEYMQTPNHSTQETQETWEKYNSLLEKYGVEKNGSVFQIYNEVFSFFQKERPNGLTEESQKTWTGFYLRFATNLWNFYYQIAFTYDLSPENQDNLLQYLIDCRNDSNETRWFFNQQVLSFGIVDIDTWDSKYFELWEKGTECGSAFAMRELANCYYHRISVDLKDYDKAFSLYQQAAQLGDMQAVYMLGQCYEYARGTRRDYQKAGDCYMYAYNCTKNPDCSKAINRLYDGNRWDKNRYSPDIFDCSNTPVMKKTNLAKLKEDMDKCLHTDLDTADLAILAVSIGMISETIIKSFVECYESAYLKADPSEQIELLRNRGYFTKEMFYQTTTVRKLRNRGAHNRDGDPITLDEIKQALHFIREIVDYYEQF